VVEIVVEVEARGLMGPLAEASSAAGRRRGAAATNL